MVTLKMALREDAEKGLLAEERIWEAFQNFFSLGVKSIEEKCNRLRNEMLMKWKRENAEDFMTEYGLSDVTYQKGIEEATPTFDLYEPESIEVKIYETRICPSNPRASMAIEKSDKEGKVWRLHVFLRNFERKEETLHWIEFCMKIEKVMFHELLHACGDSPWRGRVDGVIRHYIIGIEAIQQLLSERDIEN